MARDSDDDVPRAALVVTAGMVLPAIPVGLARDVPDTAHTEPVPLPWIGGIEYRVFLVVLAVGFGLLAWGSIRAWPIDRLSFLFTAIVWPWIVAIGGLFAVLAIAGRTYGTHPVAETFSHLTGGGQVIPYGAAFTLAGLAAALLAGRDLDALSGPDPNRGA